jgi:hypothetical protein
LVEATEVSTSYADSVVALVPTGPLANELSQEEFLPLAAGHLLAELPTEPAATAETVLLEAEIIESEPAATDAAAEPNPVGNPSAPVEPNFDEPTPLNQAQISLATSSPAPGPAVPTPLPTAPAAVAAALVRPALVWQQVRVLRLPAPAAPTLVWDGTANAPAAPYLGSSEPDTQPSPAVKPALETSAVAAALLAATETAASALAALRTPGPLAINPLPPISEAAPAPAYLLEELPAAPDAESDAAPLPASGEPGPLTAASTTELSAAAAAPDEAVLTTPMQAAELAAPELLAPPAAAPPAAAEPEFYALEEPGALAALRPAGQQFDAPDLNFQIIQYARLAVPRALAEQPFEVIYAPAWPTWLAAQELRHRSGQPLVLHLAQLAATDDELIDLAAGWVAEIQRQALHRADLILTETAALAQRLRHELALPTHRVRAVPAADAAAVAQALRTAVRW